VAEVSGKRRKLPFDIGPIAIPAEECPDREPMPEIMHARPRMIAWAAQASLPRQSPEDPVNILVQQPAASLGNEEMRAATRSKVSGTPVGIAAQDPARRRMQGNEARLAEFGVVQKPPFLGYTRRAGTVGL